MTSGTPIKAKRALVLGGGITGLATAAAMSEHFESVVVLERGRYESRPTVRAQVAQGAHAHILLASGLLALQQLVPELPGWLDEMGIAECDLTHDIRLCFDGQWLPRTTSGIPFRPCSRPVVEHLLLRAVQQRPNIEVRTGWGGRGLLGDGRVEGVEARDPEGQLEQLDADLTILAMGRGGQAVDWVETLTGESVPVDVVDPGLTYTSCTFEPGPDLDDAWNLAVDVSRFPEQSSTAVIVKSAPNEWLASWAEYGRVSPPKTIEDFRACFASVSSGFLAEQLRRCRPTSALHSFPNTANRRRRFGAVKRWPEGLVVVGDSVCSLNPRYGQGMTVGLLGVQLLLETLEAHWSRYGRLDGFAGLFTRAMDKRVTVPWGVALMEDKLWAAKFENRPLGLLGRATMHGTRRALQTALSDMDTYMRFMRVSHLLESPLHMATPATVAKMVFPSLRRL